ncbi:MAG: hypothetical protein K2J07_05410, partial [Muribaculaceae bacterium]|nr:hypothetical protein [Muribaculaceae bacterium]
PEYQSMIDKEFAVRYNLAHPHIVMINDYEEVPGLGRCIITDDIYGDSLRKLIDSSRVSDATIDKLTHDLVDALEYIQTNHLVHHPIRPETIIFTENIGNLKLINVGFDQKNSLSPDATADDIFNFGLILTEALKANPKYPDASRLRKIAARCLSPNPAGRFPDIRALKMAIDGRAKIATIVLTTVFIVLMVGVLAWLVGKG